MQKLNTTAVYILSIVGFLCCCVYGLGTVASIIAVVLAFQGLKKYNENPELYSNGKQMKTAKTVAIVSLIFSLIGLAFVIYVALNECSFYESMYNWAAEGGASDADLEGIRVQMQAADCNY